MKYINKFIKPVSKIVAATMLFTTVAPTVVFAYDNGTQTQVTTTSEKDLDRKLIGYFADWAYKSEARGYFDVADLQWDYLTHIQYSFGKVNPTTNEVEFIDPFAAVEEDFADHEMTHKGEVITIDERLPYKGHMNIITQMKKKYPDVKVTISLGGWAGSRGFYTMLDTDKGIETFVNSAVEFIRAYNLDGVDIDFEYPSSTSQSGNPDDFDLSEPRRDTINERYNVMMKKLNKALDQAAKEDGKEYILSAAVAASSWILGGVESNEYAKELDYLSIMSYDYHGGWNQFVGNQANIYPDPEDKETAGLIMPVLGADWAAKYFQGIIPPEKILMGVPYYTRGWENVQPGPSGTGLNGTSNTPATGKYNTLADLDENGNPIPAGVNNLWHAMNLVEQDSNLKVHWDNVGKVPYLWNGDEKVFLTFENEQSIDERLKYIEENNLGGALIWTMDGDYDLNPNYIEGSTNINEGKYTFGDTLTKRFSNGLKAMGPNEKTPEDNEGIAPIAVGVELSGKYDHPNYTYDFEVTNYTDEVIKGGWELSFDLPKSAKFKSAWGGQVTEKDNGVFTTITIKSPEWQNIESGASTNLQGMIGLCFSGVRNVRFNGMNPLGKGAPQENQAPIIKGVADQTIYVEDPFNPLEGVTATDKEDGDLTAQIQVEGEVDTMTPGEYSLIYSVTDREGLITTATSTVTVLEAPANEAPAIYGVTDQTIKVGERFDALEGVTAIDKEDGDLTAQIQVEGEVDTTQAGKYAITYKVVDSEGLETTKVRIITVQATSVEGDTYDPEMIYYGGEIVVYKGQEYKAKWWVQGQAPDTSDAWELVVKPNEDGSIDWYEGLVCIGGETVVYNGQVYKAKWWTNTIPGSDGSWELIQ